MLDMSLRHAKECSYVRHLLALVRRFGEGTRFDDFDLCCRDSLYDLFYPVQVAEH